MAARSRGVPCNAQITHQIWLAESWLPAVDAYLTRFLETQTEPLETGGMLVGTYAEEAEGRSFHIHGLIEAGPKAECSADSVLFDHEYQSQILQQMRQQDPRLGNMGCFHLHPGEMDACSTGDRLADIAAVKESDTRALVFGIVTMNNPRSDPLSVCYGNLKIDFFVMAEQNRFEYVHIRPTLGNPESLKPSARREEAKDFEGVSAAQMGTHHSWGPGLLEDKRRLVAEVRAMEERYGDRAVLRYERNQLFWEYTVVESGRRFPIEVRYPRRYPLEPPRIISILALPSSPHQLVNNELCWINRAAGDWNPARDTAATCIHAAQRWFACLLVYLTLGKWPEEANDEPLRTL
ncbi:MAG TPA: hypothetical protein VL361_17365 [Candidatus Limnocylindrales bacterium]|nr:hypothetical protein [Candidatus Limnocylindrales bacterium]